MEITNTLTYQIDPDRGLVLVTYHGLPTIEDGQRFLGQMLVDPDYHPGYGILVDRRRIRAATTHFVQSMVRLVDQNRKRLGAPRWAILVSDPESFGMGRMAEQLTDFQGSIRVFRNLADAQDWLLATRDQKTPPTKNGQPQDSTRAVNDRNGASESGWSGIDFWALSSSLLWPWAEATHVLG